MSFPSNNISPNAAGAIALSPDMGSAILDHLSTMCDLSQFQDGYVAGQSVASAVFDLYGFGGGSVYNDIDLFIPTLEFICEQMIDEDYFAGTKSYRVMKVGRSGMINTIYCAPDTLSGEHLISDFDLNCVQVAVNIKTREMIWTAAFLEFCLVRVIKVDSLFTPCHSLVRYFLKRDVLPLATGDDVQMLEMIAMTIDRWSLLGRQNLPAFGTKFLEQKYRKVESRLADFDLLQKPSDDGKKMFWLAPKSSILDGSVILDYAKCMSVFDICSTAIKVAYPRRVHNDQVYSF